MKGNIYTLVYSAMLGGVCALLMAGAGRFTAPYRQANVRAEEVRNILAVLEAPGRADAGSQELLKAFEKNVLVEKRGSLELYTLVNPESPSGRGAVAVPFAGQGLWGPIKGFLSLEPDMKTIRGVTFHEQEETPGLGGEIVSDWFRKQFRGKSIEAADGRPGIRIRRGGGSKAANEVDGITGATMTSSKVETMLNAVITTVVKERDNHGQ